MACNRTYGRLSTSYETKGKEMTQQELFKIWGVVHGPWDDGEHVWLTCKIEHEGKMVSQPQDIPYPDFNAAYKDLKHFDTSIEPIVKSVDLSWMYNA